MMYNLVELFSGIGSQARALRNIGESVNTAGTSEWDIHALVAYDIIHRGGDIPAEIQKMSRNDLLNRLKDYTFSNTGKSELDFNALKSYKTEVLKKIYTSVTENNNYVDVSKLSGNEMADNIDILTYSFPCQDLSNVGAFHGYNKGIDKGSGSRSSLLWQVGRILTEMEVAGKQLPRFLLMENVPTLLSERHLKNFTTWISDLKKLGYVSKYFQLNSSDFGLPQNRPRLLMISVHVGDDLNLTDIILDYFRSKNESDVISDYHKSPYFHQYSIDELLRNNYDDETLFEEAVACTPNDTPSRRKIWDDNPKLVLKGNRVNRQYDCIRTVTTKQDRNPNSGNLYFDSGIQGKSKFRYLTPRECMLFMGFTDKDYDGLIKSNAEFHKGDQIFSRDKLIRMAGNSIPVKLLEGIFLQIKQIDQIITEYNKHPYISFDKNGETKDQMFIRKKLYAHKIRIRNADGFCPSKAYLMYPKYKTAIYNYDPFWHTYDYVPKENRTFWIKEISKYIEEDNKVFEEALNNGWNIIILWNERINGYVKVKTVDEIAKLVSSNLNSDGAHIRIIKND